MGLTEQQEKCQRTSYIFSEFTADPRIPWSWRMMTNQGSLNRQTYITFSMFASIVLNLEFSSISLTLASFFAFFQIMEYISLIEMIIWETVIISLKMLIAQCASPDCGVRHGLAGLARTPCESLLLQPSFSYISPCFPSCPLSSWVS
jgi:hypothetical protein